MRVNNSNNDFVKNNIFDVVNTSSKSQTLSYYYLVQKSGFVVRINYTTMDPSRTRSFSYCWPSSVLYTLISRPIIFLDSSDLYVPTFNSNWLKRLYVRVSVLDITKNDYLSKTVTTYVGIKIFIRSVLTVI